MNTALNGFPGFAYLDPRPRNDVLGYREFHVLMDLITDGYGSTEPSLGSEFHEVSPACRKFS